MADTFISNKGPNGEPIKDKDGNIVAGAEIIAIPDSQLSFPSNGGESRVGVETIVGKTDSNGEYELRDELFGGAKDYHVIARWTDSNGNVRQVTPNYPKITAESPLSVLEDFEGSDPLANYTGDKGSFSIVSSPVYSNSQALASDAGSGRQIYIDNPSIEMDRTKGVNYRYYTYFSNPDDGRSIIYIFNQSDGSGGRGDGYLVNWDNTDDGYTLLRADGGNITTLDSGTTSFPSNEWLRCDIVADSSTLDITLYDSADNQIANLSAADGNHNNGGFGFEQNNVSSSDNVLWDLLTETN